MPVLKFGKYQGHELRDVPDDYLSWLIEIQTKTLAEYQAEQRRRLALQNARLSWAERIIQTGFRTLAMEFHPDQGGDNESMRQIIAAQERLRELIGQSGMT